MQHGIKLRRGHGRNWAACAMALLVLAACEEREPILEGDRVNIRDVLRDSDAVDTVVDNQSIPVALGAQTANSNWAQSPVSPHVRTTHAALAASLQPAWSVRIGEGDSRRKRLNADPVAADGRIFTIDADHTVSAVSAAGAVLWTYTLVPGRDDPQQAQGGGLAVGDGRLYVASGFGTLTALDPASGDEIWVQRLGATSTGAPALRDGVIYITSGDQTGWALEADTGRIRWQIEGVADVNNVAGAPAPAVGAKHVVFAFGNGTVQGAFRQGGLRLWNADLLGRRTGVTVAGIDDVTGDPLIAGETVYAGNHSGRVVALSVHNGSREWTAREGALGPLWPVGNAVFFVSDRNRLVRLDAKDGSLVWAVDLPGYQPTRRPNKRRDVSYANFGPILAGGRLIVASSDGLLRSFDPAAGALVNSVEIPGGATTRPIVAGGVLYVVSAKGVLHAYR